MSDCRSLPFCMGNVPPRPLRLTVSIPRCCGFVPERCSRGGGGKVAFFWGFGLGGRGARVRAGS